MTFNDTGATGRSRGETSGNGGLSPEAGAGVPREPGLDARSLADLAAQDALELSRTPDAATMPLTADGGDGWSRTEASGPVPRPSTVAPGALEAVKDQGSSPEIQSPVTPRLFGQTMVRGAAMGQPETADDSKSGSGSGEEVLRTGTFTPDQGPTDVLPVSEDTGTGDRGTTNRLLGSDLTPRGGSGGGDTEAAGAQDSSPADLDTTDPDQDSHPDTETLGASSPDDLKTGGTNPDSELASDPDAPSTSLEVSQSPMEPDDTKTEPTPPMALFLGTTTGTAAETPGATVARTSSTDNPSHPGTMEARDTTGGDDPSTDGPDNPDNSSGTTDPASGGSSSELVRKNSGDNPTPSPQAGGTGAGQGNGEDVGGTGGDSGDGGGGDENSGESGDESWPDNLLREIWSRQIVDRLAEEISGLQTHEQANGDQVIQDAGNVSEMARDYVGELLLTIGENLAPYEDSEEFPRLIGQALANMAELALRRGEIHVITHLADMVEGIAGLSESTESWAMPPLLRSLSRILLLGQVAGDETLRLRLATLLEEERATYIVQLPVDSGATRTLLDAVIVECETPLIRSHDEDLAKFFIYHFGVDADDRHQLLWAHLSRLSRQGVEDAREQLGNVARAYIEDPATTNDFICMNAFDLLAACDSDELRDTFIMDNLTWSVEAWNHSTDVLRETVTTGLYALDHPANSRELQARHIRRFSYLIERQHHLLIGEGVSSDEVLRAEIKWRTEIAAYHGDPSDRIVAAVTIALISLLADQSLESEDRTSVMAVRDGILRNAAVRYIKAGTEENVTDVRYQTNTSGALDNLTRAIYALQVIGQIQNTDTQIEAYVACWKEAKNLQQLTGLRPADSSTNRVQRGPVSDRMSIIGDHLHEVFEASQALFSNDVKIMTASALRIIEIMQRETTIDQDGQPADLNTHPYWELITTFVERAQALAPRTQEGAWITQELLPALARHEATHDPTSPVMDPLYHQLLRTGQLADFRTVLDLLNSETESELSPIERLEALSRLRLWLEDIIERNPQDGPQQP